MALELVSEEPTLEGRAKLIEEARKRHLST